MDTEIRRDDISGALGARDGNATFSRALSTLGSAESLLRLFANYIHFNAVFGAGVANLAGELGVRRGLFRDPDEPIWFLADRSMEVASEIFAAAVDEFDDRSTPYRDTHRTLARATFKGIARHFGWDTPEILQIATILTTTHVAAHEIERGYAVGQSVEEPALFQALGFHLGSELLADGEFRLLDTVLAQRWPELRAALQGLRVDLGGASHDAYLWIQIHTSVEADHFDFAVTAANKALQFYAGARDHAAVKADILRGVQGFAAVQAEFMTGLAGASAHE